MSEGSRAPRRRDALAVGVVVVAYVAIVGSGALGVAATELFDNLAETAAALIAAASCVAAARRAEAGSARAWWLLSASALSWGLGQVFWSYCENIAHIEPFPSAADVGYLAAIPLAVAALLSFPSTNRHAGRMRALTDALVAALAVLGISWAFVLKPVAAASGSGFDLALALLYPIGDVVLFAIALSVIARVTDQWRSGLTTVGVAVAGLALADSVFVYNTAVGHNTTSAFNVGWVAGYLVIAVAAHRSRSRSGEADLRGRAPGRWMVSLPFVPVVVFTLAAAADVVAHSHVDNAFVWTGIPLVLLLVTRQHFIHRDNLDLMQNLEEQISALAISREDLRHQALHDPLTGLPNRAHLMRELAGRFAGPIPAETALLLLDLDRFKEINDGLGHDVGDQVLCEVAVRLRQATPSGDTVVRLGGDEFALVIDDPPGADRADGVATAILAAFRRPVEVDGMSLPIDASIGVAHGTDAPAATNLMQCADVAMYRAKRQGMSVAYYGLEDQEDRPGRLALLADLRRSLDEGILDVHYQPVVDLTSGDVLGVEALARWHHPEKGWIPPDQFIPFAEQTGLIGPLTQVVLLEALAQCARWQEQGISLQVSVNLSPKTLQDRTFVHELREAILGARLTSRHLTLEITESAFAHKTEVLIATLERLRSTGVRLSIDDFGTGYSSLSHLKRLPVHELKIDRTFVTDIATDDHDQAIVRSVVTLAHTLGLSVVAEGVEDADSLAVLGRLGCDAAQGFHLCRPADAAAITEWLGDRGTARPAAVLNS